MPRVQGSGFRSAHHIFLNAEPRTPNPEPRTLNPEPCFAPAAGTSCPPGWRPFHAPPLRGADTHGAPSVCQKVESSCGRPHVRSIPAAISKIPQRPAPHSASVLSPRWPDIRPVAHLPAARANHTQGRHRRHKRLRTGSCSGARAICHAVRHKQARSEEMACSGRADAARSHVGIVGPDRHTRYPVNGQAACWKPNSQSRA